MLIVVTLEIWISIEKVDKFFKRFSNPTKITTIVSNNTKCYIILFSQFYFSDIKIILSLKVAY